MVEQLIIQIKTKQNDYRADKKHLKLNSNLDTRLAHNTLGMSEIVINRLIKKSID